MTLRVHPLDCGSMCPLGAYLFQPRQLRAVCQCWLIETEAGLVLVDTGFGRADARRAWTRLGLMKAILRPRLGPEDTAWAQVRALGFDPRDVRHVIPTHLDLDHAGGLSDFPWATVHVLRAEREASQRRAAFERALRYRPDHWAHGPRWSIYEADWREVLGGAAGARALPGLPPELRVIPLPGHTAGHVGVAVETSAGTWLHAGDAYYHRRTRRAPRHLGIRRLQVSVHEDVPQALRTHARLDALERAGVRVVCAHDPNEFAALRADAADL